MSIVLSRHRVLRLLVLAGLVLGAAPSLSAAVVYDFVAKAPEAKWYRALSSEGALPWNGGDGDSRGFARHLANVPLESGKTFTLVLETHPEWKPSGMIYSVYSNILVPANARFSAMVGFLKGATATTGVTFMVLVVDQATGTQLLMTSKPAKADGVLDELAADLGPCAGKTVTVRLQVHAGSRSTQDWAVWASAVSGREEDRSDHRGQPPYAVEIGNVQERNESCGAGFFHYRLWSEKHQFGERGSQKEGGEKEELKGGNGLKPFRTGVRSRK